LNSTFCRILSTLLTTVLFCAAALAQDAAATRSVLILPFENATHQPTLEWISETFPEVVGQRLAAQSMYVISREDRQYAFDRMGIPVNLHASRATLYRIATQLDVDYILLGSYSYDGQTFTARAQLLDMKALRLSPDMVESGPLTSLISLQTALAWDISRDVYPNLSESRQSFVQRAPVIRLDAFENFIRGVVAGAQAEKIRYLTAATTIDPGYAQAILLLGRTYYDTAHDYEHAAEWFAKMPMDDAAAPEANFYRGLSEYHLGHFEKAAEAFKATAERVPLTEVLNNIGVAESRRGHPDALNYFQKAAETDSSDADYHFNLAVALSRHSDLTAAQRQIKESLSRRPNDLEAQRFQESLTAAAAAHTPVASVPLARIKHNYDESSYRRLAVDLQNAIEASVDKAKPSQRASMHIERAREFLASGANDAAESQFREALIHEPMNAEALSGLARTLQLQGKFAEARYQAIAANRLQPGAEAYLVLARADLHDNNIPGAQRNLQLALNSDPNSQEARTVAQEIQNHSLQPVPSR
jgi:tetratricopeptide (TPR) repeat protein